jgi:hypothetical protein
MQLISLRTTRSKTSLALAVLALQAGSAYSAATVNITATRQFDLDGLGIPGALVVLTSSSPFSSGEYYAGVLAGTADYDGVGGVAPINTSFFCTELNNNISLGSSVYNDSTLGLAAYRNGNPVNGGALLTTQQKCMLMGVYEALGITTVNGFVSSTDGVQSLSGTTSSSDAAKLRLSGPLSHERAAAAQLVIWEIIHEPVNSFYYNMAPVIGLNGVNGGNLVWSLGNNAEFSPDLPSWATITAEFNDIAGDAYAHAASTCGLVAVPEITSPVALLAGGLLFVRRRERRGSRLKSPVVR